MQLYRAVQYKRKKKTDLSKITKEYIQILQNTLFYSLC